MEDGGVYYSSSVTVTGWSCVCYSSIITVTGWSCVCHSSSITVNRIAVDGVRLIPSLETLRAGQLPADPFKRSARQTDPRWHRRAQLHPVQESGRSRADQPTPWQCDLRSRSHRRHDPTSHGRSILSSDCLGSSVHTRRGGLDQYRQPRRCTRAVARPPHRPFRF